MPVGYNRFIPLEDWFWSKVQKTDGCWLWTGYITLKGYGEMTRKHIRVHRFSWELVNGKIPGGLNVLHKCDNTICVRPDHLFLGTHADNVHDMMKKGRSKPGKTFGEENPRHKLTLQQVKEIKEALDKGANVISLAKQYGVHRNHIYGIKKGRVWKEDEAMVADLEQGAKQILRDSQEAKDEKALPHQG